jgi:peptidoglycan/LPS O-acetylase OafA/YrhL
MNEIEQLKTEIEAIKLRNKNVEANKAWETSISRKIMIAVLTYIVIVIFFFSASLPNPFINAIVPTVGFILSTLSLPLLKNIWLKNIYKNKL